MKDWLKLLDELEEIRQITCETKKDGDTRAVIDSCMECLEKSTNIPNESVSTLLENLEERKKRAKDRPLAYPASFVVRCICADVACIAGFESRTEWTELLKKDKDSKYAGRYEGRTGTFYL